jgi:hypothetical protein
MPAINPAQWTIDRVFGVMRAVERDAEAVKRAIDSNDQAIADLSVSLAEIPGPPAPGPWNPLTPLRNRQAQIKSMYGRAVRYFGDFARRVDAFLVSHGIQPSSGLSGLGAAIVLPLAIIAGALIALAFIEWMKSANSAQTGAINLQQRALSALIAKQITPAEYQTAVTASEQAANAKMPKSDPMGLAAFAEALIPLGLITLAIVVALNLPKLMGRDRARLRAA